MKKEIITKSVEETFAWAEDLGKSATRGSVFALQGELGSGKTIVAKGIAKGLGIDDDVTSPTFLLVEIYENSIPLYHFDLYRIESANEFDELNFEEYWEGDGVSVIEWAEKAGDRLPDNTVRIDIQWIDENERRIILENPDD